MTVFNFSAGPAAIPTEVKQTIASELYDWQNTGCSVMEVSHRSQEFIELAAANEALARELLAIPDDYEVMMIPGGARLQYAMLPMNLSAATGAAVFAVNGHWGRQCIQEASQFTQASSTAPIQTGAYAKIPSFDPKSINPNADYFHYTSNETLEGVQWHHTPDTNGVPLCCDMTSDLLTRTFDCSQYAMIYASAQKNMGIAGVTFVVMKKSMIGHSKNQLPTMLNYQTYAESGSMYNTPPTFAWYVMYLVLQWVKQQGGVSAIAAANHKKSAKLYNYVDASGFYLNKVDIDHRSRVNVPFWLRDEGLNEKFLIESSAAGLKALKGHRAVGGMRASIYNAMPEAGIDALLDFMQEFERVNG